MTGAFLSGVSSMSVSSVIDPRRFSGHSMRAGGATLFTSRIPYWVVKKMGWTSDAALKYYRSEEDVVVASVRQALGVCLDQP
jgi:hypothetical protein